jgi:hypothetical protein
MKKTIVTILILACFSFGQGVIENPGKPSGRNAGRIVDLEEVLSIQDTGDEYYFKYPSNLKIAPDGSIFVQDWSSKLLARFDADGKFLHDYFREGQGPGELDSVGNYFFDGDSIVIYDSALQKILRLDFEGKTVEEFKVLRTARAFQFVLCHNTAYYFIQHDVSFESTKPTYTDVPYQLVVFNVGGDGTDPLVSFSLSAYVVGSGGGGGGYFPMDQMLTAPLENRYLFISRKQEYLIELFDAETNRIVRAFTRDYKRVKPSSEYKEMMKKGSLIVGGKRYTEPPRKYRSDIQNLFVDGDELWVMTSTEDKKKGILFDVFDLEGKYVDNFYVRFDEENFPKYGGGNRMTVSGEYLYQIESTPDETYVIKKYRMKGLR